MRDGNVPAKDVVVALSFVEEFDAAEVEDRQDQRLLQTPLFAREEPALVEFAVDERIHAVQLCRVVTQDLGLRERGRGDVEIVGRNAQLDEAVQVVERFVEIAEHRIGFGAGQQHLVGAEERQFGIGAADACDDVRIVEILIVLHQHLAFDAAAVTVDAVRVAPVDAGGVLGRQLGDDLLVERVAGIDVGPDRRGENRHRLAEQQIGIAAGRGELLTDLIGVVVVASQSVPVGEIAAAEDAAGIGGRGVADGRFGDRVRSAGFVEEARRGEELVDVVYYVLIVAREERHAGCEGQGRLGREVELRLVVVARAADDLHTVFEILEHLRKRHGDRLARVVGVSRLLGIGSVGNARIAGHIVQIEEVGIERQQAEVRVGAAQQRLAARAFELRGLAVLVFQFVDGLQGVIGGRYGSVGCRPVGFVAVPCAFARERVFAPAESVLLEGVERVDAGQRRTVVDEAVAAGVDYRVERGGRVGRNQQRRDFFRRIDVGTIVGIGAQKIGTARKDSGRSDQCDDYFSHISFLSFLLN